MPIIEICANCGRQRPSGISDPSCSEFGYCKWVEKEILADPRKAATKRESVKQAFEYLAKALNPTATSEEKFAIDVAIDMLLDALEIGL